MSVSGYREILFAAMIGGEVNETVRLSVFGLADRRVSMVKQKCRAVGLLA